MMFEFSADIYLVEWQYINFQSYTYDIKICQKIHSGKYRYMLFKYIRMIITVNSEYWVLSCWLKY